MSGLYHKNHTESNKKCLTDTTLCDIIIIQSQTYDLEVR
nr:MAG TPA: hypothetical protein [Caudoviricetes sp.]